MDNYLCVSNGWPKLVADRIRLDTNRSIKEFRAKFESLKPTEKQREWLSGKTTDEEDDSEESGESEDSKE